jgi:hypothetical protein
MRKVIIVLFFKLIVPNILAQPVISSFNPSSGQIGTTVIISGSNFNSTLADNVVYFGATKATVISGNTSSLTVSVPVGASYQPISVTDFATGLTAFSSQSFNVTYPCGGSVKLQETKMLLNYELPSSSGVGLGIVSGDLDGDGKVDVANIMNGMFFVQRNTSTIGAVSFASPLILYGDKGSGQATIGDFDGDGKLDLAIVSDVSRLKPDLGPNTVLIFRNTSVLGSISFDSPYYLVTGDTPSCISTGDYNGDGKPDLAVTNSGSKNKNISIFRNTGSKGTISFAQKVDLSIGLDNFFSIATGDFNDDGKQDLAVSYTSKSKVSVFKNITVNGEITFEPMLDFITAGITTDILIGDLDGDSKTDIAALSVSLSILRNTSNSGKISFDPKIDFTAEGGLGSYGSIGDLDGDNKLDIATVYPAIQRNGYVAIHIQRNTSSPGSISFQSNGLPNGYTNPGGVSINDFDCDGKADLAITDFTIDNKNTYANFGVYINKHVCPATTITSYSPISGPIGTSVTIIGTNFDSTPSNNIVFFGATKAIVTSGSTTSLTVTVPLGASYLPISVTNLTTGLTAYSSKQFNVTFPCGGVINQSSLAPKVDFANGKTPFSVATGDLDNDGKPDLVVVNDNSATVSVYRNIGTDGTISYAPKVDFITGSKPNTVSLADYNGDGKLDLAVVNYNSVNVSIFINTSTTGTISFSPKVDFATSPGNIISNDFDGDGKMDIATVHYGSTISILRNNGALGIVSFESKVQYITGNEPYVLSSGDIDGDGKADIAVANFSSNSVSIFRNTCVSGTISFAPKVDFTTGKQPRGISIGDIDQDGKLDIAITNYGSNTLSILRNLSNIGTISFASKVDYTTGTQPYSVSIADVDGDNKLDATVVNFGGNTISLLKNTSNSGSVNFMPKVDYLTGIQPRECAITDFDGDGKLDVSVVYANTNTISFFRNLVSGVIPNVTANSSSANSICAGASIILTGGGADTFTWTGGVNDGVSFIPPNGTTIYTVTGTVNSSGCSNSDTISIISGPDIKINSSATSICIGESITLTAAGADSYSWNNGVANGVSFIPTETKQYTVIGKDDKGCINTSNVLVTVNALPKVIAIATKTAVCTGESVTLTGTGASTYIWDNNVNNGVSFVPTETKQYSVIGKDDKGCINTSNILVTVNTLPTVVATTTKTAVCAGESVTLTGTGTSTYIWDNNVNNGVSFVPSETKTYTVSGTDVKGCSKTTTVNIKVYQLPTVTISLNGPATCCSNKLTELVASNGLSYLWNDGTTSKTIKPNQSGSYFVKVTDVNGCSASSEPVYLTVNDCASIEQLSLQSVQIFPNPTTDLLSVEVSEDLIQLGYKIMDVSGKEIVTGKLNHTLNTIDVEDLATGSYFFEIENGYKTKFIKQ